MIDKLLDQKSLAEYRERRSLYRIFAPFSGAEEKGETFAEQLKREVAKRSGKKQTTEQVEKEKPSRYPEQHERSKSE